MFHLSAELHDSIVFGMQLFLSSINKDNFVIFKEYPRWSVAFVPFIEVMVRHFKNFCSLTQDSHGYVHNLQGYQISVSKIDKNS